MSTPQLSKPEPKLEKSIQKLYWSRSLFIILLHKKKDLHIYNLILQRKLFFHPTSLLIYDIVNPLSFNPEGLAYFFHRYVLLVYFIPIDAKHKSFT